MEYVFELEEYPICIRDLFVYNLLLQSAICARDVHVKLCMVRSLQRRCTYINQNANVSYFVATGKLL